MGLDSVELVMRVEEALGIELHAHDVEDVRTPRQLIDLVAGKLAAAATAPHCLTQRAFYELRKGLVEVLNLPRRSIRPDTKVCDLIPRAVRRRVWRDLKLQANLPGLPELTAGWPLVVGSGVVGYYLAYTFAKLLTPGGMIFWICFFALIFWPAVFWLTKPLHWEIPARCVTVGDIAHHMSIYHPKGTAGNSPSLSREDIAKTVRSIVSDQLGVKDFSDDADFIYDLRMG